MGFTPREGSIPSSGTIVEQNPFSFSESFDLPRCATEAVTKLLDHVVKLLVAQPFAGVPNAAAALGWRAARRPFAGLKACATSGPANFATRS